jgi:hypothetical protein
MEKIIEKENISNLVQKINFETVNGERQLRLRYIEFTDIKAVDFIKIFLKKKEVCVDIFGEPVYGLIKAIDFIEYDEETDSNVFDVVIDINYILLAEY